MGMESKPRMEGGAARDAQHNDIVGDDQNLRESLGYRDENTWYEVCWVKQAPSFLRGILEVAVAISVCAFLHNTVTIEI